MAIITASGTKLYIGPVAADSVDTLAEIKALTPWVEVKKVENYGDYGDESSEVTFQSVGDARVEKAKGGRNAGTLAITVGLIPDDPGQIAMIAAEASNQNFAFKVVYPDKVTPTGTGTAEYFRGLVMSKRKSVGTSDNVLKRAFNIGINSEIFEDPAT